MLNMLSSLSHWTRQSGQISHLKPAGYSPSIITSPPHAGQMKLCLAPCDFTVTDTV
jgi:hypothetical protein